MRRRGMSLRAMAEHGLRGRVMRFFFSWGKMGSRTFCCVVGWFIEFVRVLVWGFGEAKMYEVRAWLGKTGGCTWRWE